MTHNVEFIVCWDNHTWTVEEFLVPDEVAMRPIHEIEEWMTLEVDRYAKDKKHVVGRMGMDRVVAISLYCLDPILSTEPENPT
jgi:hypothetical protein